MVDQTIHDCCRISLRRNEPMVGSVKPVSTWLLLEYDAPMGSQALLESDIPPSVKGHLNEALDLLPGSRVLLVKSWHAQVDRGIRFSLVNGREIDPYFRTFALESYQDLLDIDLHFEMHRKSDDQSSGREPFYLVCTNGKRDPCCAQMGLPVFGALQTIDETRVWQSSHVGGHRFAANVLAFPHGIYYGRVQPDDAARLFAAGDAGEILIDRYRGRACYEKVVQAAEAHLRRRTGQMGFGDFIFKDMQQKGEDRWLVSFGATQGARVHSFTMETQLSENVDFVSCRDDKRSPVIEYIVSNYQIN